MLLKNKPQPHQSSTQSNKDTDFIFPSFEQIKGSQVYVSLKKPTHHNPVKKQLTEENAYQASKKLKSPQKNERKTIERTIKQLLKGKQQLANYLESQKQFIQVLDVHDHQLRNRSQNRGKLASSLTQKKKSRIDTYTAAKKSIYSHLSKVSRNGKILIAKSEALTMEVVKKQGESCEQGSGAVLQKRQYETVSFNDVCSQGNEDQQDCGKTKFDKEQRHKKQQKYNHHFQVSSKQNYHPGQQCIVMTSPKKKQLKLNQKTSFQNNSFYATKYGLTHFSPWAFPKNQYDTELCQNPSVLQDKKINEDKVFREKLMNYEEKPTKNEARISTMKGQTDRKQNTKHYAGNPQKQNLKNTISDNPKERQNNQKQTIHIGSQRKQNCSIQQRYLSLEPKRDSTIGSNGQSNVKVVKSSQVMILQSETVNMPEIFASKEQAKQMFYPRKSLKFESSQAGRNSVSIEARVFQTEVNIEQGQKDRTLIKQAELKGQAEEGYLKGYLNELTKQSELGELKKTEQFLKEIILTKNSVSYANSRSISKKEFKQINQAIYEEKSSKRSNVFITKNLFQSRVVSQKSPKKKQVFTVFVQNENKSDQKVLEKNVVKERQNINENDDFSVEKQNSKNNQSDTKKKAKTSLDNPSNDKTINQFIQKSNTKCLTQASLNGFYLINESKIRNTRNSFVRRKRHSMMVKKKASQDRKSSDQSNQRRLSYSIEKQLPGGNIYDMAILEESKGFGIVNPLTKQLYKKYVSIVQNKR